MSKEGSDLRSMFTAQMNPDALKKCREIADRAGIDFDYFVSSALLEKAKRVAEKTRVDKLVCSNE